LPLRLASENPEILCGFFEWSDKRLSDRPRYTSASHHQRSVTSLLRNPTACPSKILPDSDDCCA
jgi:hypothetical protein